MIIAIALYVCVSMKYSKIIEKHPSKNLTVELDESHLWFYCVELPMNR